MKHQAPDLFSDELAGWKPSPEAQHLLLWRVLQMLMSRYGSVPLGQALVGITNTVLNEMGRAPTVTELCEATGLPKSSISRYISSQMEQGVVAEDIDPRDRRRRMLRQTEEGKKEREWMIKAMRSILRDLHEQDQERAEKGTDPAQELARMKEISANPPDEFHLRRKRGRRATA